MKIFPLRSILQSVALLTINMYTWRIRCTTTTSRPCQICRPTGTSDAGEGTTEASGTQACSNSVPSQETDVLAAARRNARTALCVADSVNPNWSPEDFQPASLSAAHLSGTVEENAANREACQLYVLQSRSTKMAEETVPRRAIKQLRVSQSMLTERGDRTLEGRPAEQLRVSQSRSTETVEENSARRKADQRRNSQSRSTETVKETAERKAVNSFAFRINLRSTKTLQEWSRAVPFFRSQSQLRQSKTLQVWSWAVPLFAVKVNWDGRRHCREKWTRLIPNKTFTPEETAGQTLAIQEDHRPTAAARYGKRLVPVDICVISSKIDHWSDKIDLRGCFAKNELFCGSFAYMSGLLEKKKKKRAVGTLSIWLRANLWR